MSMFDYNAIPDWALRHELDRTAHNVPVQPGTRCILAQANEPTVTVDSNILMPNGYYVLVRFEDGDTLTVRPWELVQP